MRRLTVTFLCLFTWPVPAWAAEADLILKNGKIWTGSEKSPWVEALAIEGSTIARAGRNSEILSLAGRATKVIDLAGKLAIPGINDAHIHFLKGALGLFEVDLVGARSLEEIQKRLAEFASRSRQQWITGAGWEYSYLPRMQLPNRAALDAVVSDRPVYLRAYDGHTGWANSKALQLAGITRNQKFQGYGEIVLDPRTGEPTGILKEGAMSLIADKIPAPARETKLAALRQALGLVASLGITSFQNANGDTEELSLYEDLLKRGELSARVYMVMSAGVKTSQDDVARFVEIKKRHTSGRLRTGAVKIFLDGVIESHTAAMLDHYSDMPDTSGVTSFTQAELNRLVDLCDKSGLQVWIHAIGDRAVQMALDAFERSSRLNGRRDSRHRIEHIETIAQSDIGRFAPLGILASMMPIHADPGTNGVWIPAIGEERSKRGFAWRSLQDAGARLVFSSDWPAVISLDPMRGIHCAVNRRTIEGDPPGGWLPEQRVSVETALRAYTVNAAYASFDEKVKGTLEKGKLADIAILSQDLFTIDPADIYKNKVVMTIFDGQVLYERK